jgi:hypothetical protein
MDFPSRPASTVTRRLQSAEVATGSSEQTVPPPSSSSSQSSAVSSPLSSSDVEHDSSATLPAVVVGACSGAAPSADQQLVSASVATASRPAPDVLAASDAVGSRLLSRIVVPACPMASEGGGNRGNLSHNDTSRVTPSDDGVRHAMVPTAAAVRVRQQGTRWRQPGERLEAGSGTARTYTFPALRCLAVGARRWRRWPGSGVYPWSPRRCARLNAV